MTKLSRKKIVINNFQNITKHLYFNSQQELEEKIQKVEIKKREILKDMKQLLREHERLKKKWQSHKCDVPQTDSATAAAEMQEKLEKMEDKMAELEDKNTYLTSDLKKMTKKNQVRPQTYAGYSEPYTQDSHSHSGFTLHTQDSLFKFMELSTEC